MRPSLPPTPLRLPSRRVRCLALLAVLAVPIGLNAQAFVRVPEGFESHTRFTFDAAADFPLQIGGLEYTSEGDPLVYEGGQIRLHRPDSTEILAVFDPPVFGSFLTLAPAGDVVYFGESSAGGIYAVALDGGGATRADTLSFNFDLAFAPEAAGPALAGKGFLSGLGSQANNSIWVLDSNPDGDNDEIVTNIPRFSGPLVFDSAGNLYYATSGFSEGKEFGERLVRFTPAELEGAIGDGAIDFFDAEVLLRGHDGLFNLVWLDGALYGTNLGFVSGVGAIERIDPVEDFLVTTFAEVVVGDGTASPGLLAVSSGAAPFAPGVGRSGGELLVAYSNFADVSNVATIAPVRFFVRGEANGDGKLDIADAVFILSFLFTGGREPDPLEAADVNADGEHDLSDAQYLLNYLFLGGPQPPAPFPEPGA